MAGPKPATKLTGINPDSMKAIAESFIKYVNEFSTALPGAVACTLKGKDSFGVCLSKEFEKIATIKRQRAFNAALNGVFAISFFSAKSHFDGECKDFKSCLDAGVEEYFFQRLVDNIKRRPPVIFKINNNYKKYLESHKKNPSTK